MSEVASQSFEEFQAQVQSEDPELHVRALSAAFDAKYHMNPLRDAGITEDRLDYYRRYPEDLDRDILKHVSPFGKHPEDVVHYRVDDHAIATSTKKAVVLRLVKSRLEHEKEEKEV